MSQQKEEKNKEGRGSVGKCEGWVAVGGVGWVTETMRLAYEARVAVRGELASPKSFSTLIHDKDNRDKRETHPGTHGHFGTNGGYQHEPKNKEHPPCRGWNLAQSYVLFWFQYFCKLGNAQRGCREFLLNPFPALNEQQMKI